MTQPSGGAVDAVIRFLVSAARDAGTIALRWDLVKGNLPEVPPAGLEDAYARWESIAPQVHPAQLRAAGHLETITVVVDEQGRPDWDAFLAVGMAIVVETSSLWIDASECLDAFERYAQSGDGQLRAGSR